MRDYQQRRTSDSCASGGCGRSPCAREILRGPVSQQNVEIIREFLDAFNRRDSAACLEAIDPDVEWHPPPDIDAPIANGRDALAAQWRDWLSTWEEYRFVPDEIVEGRGDAVLVSGEESARGKGSGIEVRSRRVTAVYELRAGRIVRLKAYLDRAEARQVAGPRE
jgi:ketosteroid isomerase-like protein